MRGFGFPLLVVLAAASVSFAAAPSVFQGGVVNHFSSARAGLPNADLAQGSIIDIYGTDIGPAKLAQFSGFPVPTEIAGTSVQVTVNGTEVDAYLFFVSAGQIACVLPSRTPAGTGTLTVTVNGKKSAPVPITVVERSIGILTLNGGGYGAATMQMPDSSGHAPLNSLNHSIQPKHVGVFYGTGTGGVTFDESKGAPVHDQGSGFHAFIGGKEAKLVFKGRAPGLVGIDQFNVEIPSGLSGCYEPVVFQTGDILSNYTTISVSADGGACPDPQQPPPTQQTGTVRTIGIDLARGSFQAYEGTVLGNIEIVSDNVSAAAGELDLSKLGKPGPPPISTTVGKCTINPLPQPTGGEPPQPGYFRALNLGPTFTIEGPNGLKHIMGNAFGYAEVVGQTDFGQVPKPPPLYLSAGKYTADNGVGSKDVPAFKVSVTEPTEFVWTNAHALTWSTDTPTTLSRSEDLTVTWTGGDPNTEVIITGTSRVKKSDKAASNVGASFTCREHNSAGHFTIPSLVLLALPPSAVLSGVQSTATVQLANTVITFFKMSGFDEAEFSFSSAIGRPVLFK